MSLQAVVLLLFLPFYLRRRRRKRRSKRAGDLGNRGFLQAGHDKRQLWECVSARIAVILRLGRKVVRKLVLERFTPKKFESRSSYLPVLLQTCVSHYFVWHI